MTTIKSLRSATNLPKPGTECSLCPRLVAYRAELRVAHPEWHNAPVLDYGPVDAELIVVGLAPGHQGGIGLEFHFLAIFPG